MYPQMVAGWLLQILVYCWVKPVEKSMLHQKLPFAVADCRSHTQFALKSLICMQTLANYSQALKLKPISVHTTFTLKINPLRFCSISVSVASHILEFHQQLQVAVECLLASQLLSYKLCHHNVLASKVISTRFSAQHQVTASNLQQLLID